MRFLRAAGGALVVFGLLLWAAPTSAHEELSIPALTVLNRVSPPIEGLDVRVVHLGAPALAVRNDTPAGLTVLGLGGEPFLRIGRSGVEANVSSPTTYRSIDPAGDAVPRKANAGGRPHWVRFSEAPSWTWFDPRLDYPGSPSPWTVTMKWGGREVVAEGNFEPLEGHGHFITSLDPPEVRGLQMRVIEGPVPAIFVRNDTGETLVIEGTAGEPFLRIGPEGVSANLRSPSYYTAGAQTIRAVPSWADAFAPPRWRRLSTQPVWAWLEHRAAVPAQGQQRAELGSQRRSVLTWVSPARLGGRLVEVTGQVEWVPPRSTPPQDHHSNPPPGWLAPAGIAIGVGLAASLARFGRKNPTVA